MKNIKYIFLYVLGVIIIIAGVVMFIVSIFVKISDIDKNSNRIVVPGEYELTLDEAGKYIIYYEYNSNVDGVIYSTENADVSGLGVLIYEKETESEIDIKSSTMNSSYSINSKSGTSVFEFEVKEPTDIILISEYLENEGPDIVLNVSQDIAFDMSSNIFATLMYLFGGLLIGGSIIVITIIFHIKARKNAKKEAIGC